MKTIKLIVFAALVSFTLKAQAQNQLTKKNTVTVVNIDSKGLSLDPVQMGNLVRMELDKTELFEVMDRYDVRYLVEKNKLNLENCYGKLCLVEIGNVLKSEKMFSGSVELFGETVVVTLRLIDVATSSIEKTQVREFLNLPNELQAMINITIHDMFGIPNSEDLVSKLTKKFDYENSINNPSVTRLNLSGPRMGLVAYTGETAKVLMATKQAGGYDMIPVMFQFGYQFEKQYLNEGNFQALFEFVPLVTGIDQGRVIPSMTFMNGLRNNKNGWEFAFGPIFSIARKADGYYEGGKWKRENEWNKYDEFLNPVPNPNSIITRMDSRGNAKLTTGFVLAFGKTFKSGKLNIPVNGYILPSKNSFTFGASFGFNAKK